MTPSRLAALTSSLVGIAGLLVAGPLAAAPAALPGLTVVASDASGVTLRFELPGYTLQPIDRAEGRFFRVDAPGLSGSTEREGRPAFPAAGGLLGVPDGAEAVVRVLAESLVPVAGTDAREPEPVGRASFRPDGTGFAPTRDFYRDETFYDGTAPWPALTAELGEVGGWRYQRVVPVRVLPFRWDPAARTLRAVATATVRVDFVPRSRVGVGSGPPGLGLDAARAPGRIAGPRTDSGFESAYERGLLNYAAAREFRSAPARPVRASTLGGPPAPAAEWRVRVDTTGVWRVTYAQLAAKGFPVGTPSSDLALSRREWAGDVTPPFIRVNVALRVLEGATGSPGTFDGDDAIVFYGQSWTDRARPTEYRARYTDHETYYLGAMTGGGPRMAEVTADQGFAAPVRPGSFPSWRRYQERYFFNYYPRDTCSTFLTWTDPYTDQTWTDSLTVFTPDPDPAGNVRMRTAFQGIALSPSSHTIWMRWKRPSDGLLTSVYTKTLFSKDGLTADTVFTANRIADGTNRLDWRGYSFSSGDPDGGPSGASLSYYEVTYDRLFRARGNLLECNSGPAEGNVEIEVDGFTGATPPAVQVYDVTDSTAPRALLVPAGFVRSTGPGVWAARFQDPVAAATRRRYVAALDAPRVADAAVSAAANENGVALWDPPGTPDYLLVTPDEFLVQARRLAQHRRSQGFDVLVAPLSEVADTYDGGRRTDWAVRRFFEDAFVRWGSRFGLLLGDGSEDPQNFTATSERDWLPAHLIGGPVGTGSGQELSPSDAWYVDDLDRTGVQQPPCVNLAPDLYSDMALGRLPAGNTAQADAMVNRLIAYDTQDREGDWRRRMLMVPDDPYSYGSFFGEAGFNYCYKFEEQVFKNITDELKDVMVEEAGYQDLDLRDFSLETEMLPTNRPIPGDPTLCMQVNSPQFTTVRQYASSTMAPRFRTALNGGALVVNFQGHGSGAVLAHETLFQSLGSAQDIDFVFNEGKPFFFLSFSCHVNQFSRVTEKIVGDGLGENMILGPQNPPRPAAGAIGSYASTNFELLPSDGTGRNHLNVWLFRSLFVDPPADALNGERGARVLLGEALALGEARALSSVFGLERRAVQTYLLLGDPATLLDPGAPRLYATANDQPVTTGVRYQPGAAGDSVVFVVDLVDDSRLDDITLSITGEGARPVDPSEYSFSPTYPDTANGGGGRRYLLNWTLAPEAKDANLVVSTRDRGGLASSFTLPLALEARLFAGGGPIADGDIAPAAGTYQFVISSPAQLLAADITLSVDGLAVPEAVIVPASTDSSRRLWTVTWDGAYPTGNHQAALTFPGGAMRGVAFSTSSEPRVALKQVFVYPSPYVQAPVTFNFTLDSDGPADVLVKVYSVRGSLVYQRVERSLNPGYHQLVWDGLDTGGDELANGAYTYQVIATDDRGLTSVERGRLARVR